MTARNMTAGVLAEINEATVKPIMLFEGEFASGTVNVWTGYGTLSWDGKSWTGLGNLIGISEISESSDIVANGMTFTLSAVDASLVSLAITEARQGMSGRLWIGFLDDNGSVIADPYKCFNGLLDVPTIQDGAETCTLQFTYENALIDMQRPRTWRYTHESQKQLFPNDLGFEYVASIQDLKITWGQ